MLPTHTRARLTHMRAHSINVCTRTRVRARARTAGVRHDLELRKTARRACRNGIVAWARHVSWGIAALSRVHVGAAGSLRRTATAASVQATAEVTFAGRGGGSYGLHLSLPLCTPLRLPSPHCLLRPPPRPQHAAAPSPPQPARGTARAANAKDCKHTLQFSSSSSISIGVPGSTHRWWITWQALGELPIFCRFCSVSPGAGGSTRGFCAVSPGGRSCCLHAEHSLPFLATRCVHLLRLRWCLAPHPFKAHAQVTAMPA